MTATGVLACLITSTVLAIRLVNMLTRCFASAI